MKRILSLTLVLVMLLALGACGKKAAEPAGSAAGDLVTISKAWTEISRSQMTAQSPRSIRSSPRSPRL